MSWAEIIALRDQLDNMLKAIRNSRNLQLVTTSTLCPCCNEPMVQGAGGVSVRATILALNRFGIAPADEVKFLEKTWAKHRRQTGVDLNGKPPHSRAMQDSKGGADGSFTRGEFRVGLPVVSAQALGFDDTCSTVALDSPCGAAVPRRQQALLFEFRFDRATGLRSCCDNARSGPACSGVRCSAPNFRWWF